MSNPVVEAAKAGIVTILHKVMIAKSTQMIFFIN